MRWTPGPPFGQHGEESDVATTPEPRTRTLVEERTDQRTDERTDWREDAGDHDKFAHYVPKDKLMQALVDGTPVRALCGKLWTPSRDPSRFPVCPECKEIWESLPENRGGDGPGDS